MTNEMMLKIAMEQSAIDSNCKPEDFQKKENIVTISKTHPDARRYLKLPHVCDLTYYGENIVATVDEKYKDLVTNYINSYEAFRCFETPNMHVLDDAFRKYGFRVCFQAEYFLPDINMLKELPCKYEMRVMTAEDFTNLYTKDWCDALCEERKELDVLGVGAYDGEKLVGLAACSADCDAMWQIGINVLEKYRKQGIASALTSKLALEILKRDKVPFYCCAWSNVRSARNAMKCGFRPTWVQLTVKSEKLVDEMNNSIEV